MPSLFGISAFRVNVLLDKIIACIYTDLMTQNLDLAATRDCRCLAARRTARALTRLYEKQLRPHGLRATQFSILAALSLKGPTPIGELAKVIGLERTTLTRSAALLERSGWVRSVRGEDGREHPLEVTPAGGRKLKAALPAWKAAQDIASEQFGQMPAAS